MLTRLIVGGCFALPLADLSDVRGDFGQPIEVASSSLPRWVPRPISTAGPSPRPRRLPPVNFVGNGTAAKGRPISLPPVPDEPFELPSLTVPSIPETPNSAAFGKAAPRSTVRDAASPGGDWSYDPNLDSSVRRPIRFPTLVTTQAPMSAAERGGRQAPSAAAAGSASSNDGASTASAVTGEPQSPSDQFGTPSIPMPMPPAPSPPAVDASQRSQAVSPPTLPPSDQPIRDHVVDPMTPLPEALPLYRPIPPGKAVRMPVVVRDGKGNAGLCDDTPLLRHWTGGYLRDPLRRLPSRLPAP